MATSTLKPWWTRALYPQDLAWLLLFSALAWVSPTHGVAEIQMLAALAIVQVAAPRIRALDTPHGNLAIIILKLVVGFLLIGVTGGIASSYYLILLLPVLSAATTLGAAGTALTTLLACVAYMAFIPLAYSLGYMLEGLFLRDLSLRVIFLPLVAYLTYGLAESNRKEAKRAQGAAAELAEANRRLREAEASVRRSERLAALGQLTAAIDAQKASPSAEDKGADHPVAVSTDNQALPLIDLLAAAARAGSYVRWQYEVMREQDEVDWRRSPLS